MTNNNCRCGSEFCTLCNPEIEVADELIPIELDDDTYDTLLSMYVSETLSKESRMVYKDYIDAGTGATQALSHAIVNEMVVRSLIDKIEREKFAEVLKEQHNKEE